MRSTRKTPPELDDALVAGHCPVAGCPRPRRAARPEDQDLYTHLVDHHGNEGVEALVRIAQAQSAELGETAPRAWCQCCVFGNHSLGCTCASMTCGHPHTGEEPVGVSSVDLYFEVVEIIRKAALELPRPSTAPDTVAHPGSQLTVADRWAQAVLDPVRREISARDERISQLYAQLREARR